MAYLNLDLDYFDHPKTKRLVGLLGRGSDALPVRLWCYCGKYHADTGHLIGYSPTELEGLIGWWGQPGKAIEVLVKLCFLEHIDAGFAVHDWDKINGHIAAFKARAQAGAAEKWRRVKAEADAQAMLKQSLSNAASNALTSLSLLSNQPEEEEGAAAPVPLFRLEVRSQEAHALGSQARMEGEAAREAAKPKKTFPPESVEYKGARFFWEYLREWAPQALEPSESGYQSWARDLDLMFRLDGRSTKAYNELMDWIHVQKESPSGFSWRKNIHSPAKLRQRWKEGKFADFLPSELAKEEFR